jgi:hypothetical protein
MENNKVIVYDDYGQTGVMVVADGVDPTEHAVASLEKGQAFIVVDRDSLPTSLEADLISAWEVDFSEPDGYGQGIQLARMIRGGENV